MPSPSRHFYIDSYGSEMPSKPHAPNLIMYFYTVILNVYYRRNDTVLIPPAVRRHWHHNAAIENEMPVFHDSE